MPKCSNIPHYDWISVGGGAAGYFGAINFATFRKEKGSQAKVLILERGSNTLTKVAVSGGGRCNLTHRCFDPRELVESYPRGSKELLSVFHKFGPKDTIEWFENRGVRLQAEKDGRIFPVTSDSQTIVQCFEEERKRLGIELRVGVGLHHLGKQGDQFQLDLGEGGCVSANHVLMATGSNREVWKILEKAGHRIVPPVPSLFSFNIPDGRLKNLSGRSFENVEIRGKVGKKDGVAMGPLLITHWGLSGPSVLKLSSLLARELSEVRYKTRIKINFFPDLDEREAQEFLKEHQQAQAKRKLKNSTPKPFPASYWISLLKVLDCDPEMLWGQMSKDLRIKVLQEIRAARFEVLGKTTNKEEFVTAGGVELKEVDFRSMQSRHFSGLYFAGEVLDIDGFTGGFNFQNAWSTSYIGAKSACDSEP